MNLEQVLSRRDPYQLYLVLFKIEGQNSYKPGITGHDDVTKRFESYLEEGIISDFKKVTSSYFLTREEAYKAEQKLFVEVANKFGGYKGHKDRITRFHNFYTKINYNGITEIRKYDETEVNYCQDYIDNNGRKEYN